MLLKKTTKRLILRPLKKDDYKMWLKAQLEVLPPQTPFDREKREAKELTKKKFLSALKKFEKDQKNDHFYAFAIFRKSDGAYIGNMALMDISREIFQNAYLGYHILNNHWNQGYAKEAGKAVLQIAFKELNLHRVEAAIAPKNKRSIAVAKALGLSKEGFSKKRLYLRGKWTDFAIYAATSEDFGYKWKTPKKKA